MTAVVLEVASATVDQIKIGLTVTYMRNIMGRVTAERIFLIGFIACTR